jgi:hypothetical protein
VDGTDAYTVAFDSGQLGMTPYVNVPRTPDRHLTLLEGEPAKEMVGPFEADAANVHTIRTRGSMFAPFDLVEFLLGKDHTAREAYLIVYPLLEDNDLLEICRPLVEFLQVASTQTTAGNPRPVSLQDRLGKGRLTRPSRGGRTAPNIRAIPPASSACPVKPWSSARHLRRDLGRRSYEHRNRDAC